jgi:hypothetical protein
MAEKTYRFLLRMPEHLRGKLAASAQRHGRSLNSEVVHRLEESLEHAPGRRARRLPSPMRPRGAWTTRSERRGMSPRYLRLGISLAVVLVLACVAIVGAFMSGGSSTNATIKAVGESASLSPALARKMAQGAAFAPSTIREGGEEISDGAQDFTMHAFPATSIPFSVIQDSRKDWKKIKFKGPGGGNKHDNPLGSRWTSLGPDNAVYPLNPFRNRFLYVPGEYVAAGRTAHVAIDPRCDPSTCRLWMGNAGGGVWMTKNALDPEPEWGYQSGSFDFNNVAALALDPNDGAGDTIYAGTGEPNICRSGCLGGVGLYKSTDGGKHWSDDPIGADVFAGRGIGSIAVKPGDSQTIFVGTGAQGSRSMSSVCCGGVDRGLNIPGAPHFGLYRSTDGGATWQLVSQGAPSLCTASTPSQVFSGLTACSVRGARRVMFDPVDPNVVYASFFSKGIWRSNDGGTTWEQIFQQLANPAQPLTGADVERAEFDVATLPNGKTRMYVGVGGGAGLAARFYRSDDVRTAPAATVQASFELLSPTGTPAEHYCDPQCGYDNYVYIPKRSDGKASNPDWVYLLGAFAYGDVGRSNGRAILLSTDAGVTFTDMSYDDSDPVNPHGVHPDQHAIVTNPLNPKQFFESSDGGIIRSNGVWADDSSDCAGVKAARAHALGRDLTPADLAFCRQVTSRVPQLLQSINKGINTLAFYSVSANPNRPGEYAGGTQDNGSWMRQPGTQTWIETFIADGASNSFDSADPDYSTLSWQSGAIAANRHPRNQQTPFWIADTTSFLPPYVREAVQFQTQSHFDPNVPLRMYTFREHVFRSTNGGVNPAFGLDKVEKHCNVWTGDFDVNENGNKREPFTDVCDDWRPLGDPGQPGRLTYGPEAACPDPAKPNDPYTVLCPPPYLYGESRSGGTVSFLERATGDDQTLWAATSTGRVFISKNAGAADPSTVTFARLDTASPETPTRYVTGIYVYADDPNHALVSYGGYNAVTPTTPGHIFSVTYDPGTGAATWERVDDDLGDLPIADVQVDESRDVLYASTDFGVMQLGGMHGRGRGRGHGRGPKGSDEWRPAGAGLPAVAVPDLTILPDQGKLLAATHGFGAWELKLQG